MKGRKRVGGERKRREWEGEGKREGGKGKGKGSEGGRKDGWMGWMDG
jgi:hypothetical protein